MRWIFGSLRRDLLFLALPGFVSLSIALTGALQENVIYYFFALAFADSGHIYTTLWRTYAHPAERQRSMMYLWVPVGVTLTFFAWSYFRIPFMWSFVVYATIHHNLKQFYGITKWYEVINRRTVKWSGGFAKALMIIPVVFYHFRSTSVEGFYASGDTLLYPNRFLLNVSLLIYAAVILAWIGCEIREWQRGFRDYNRIGAIAFCAALYGGAFGFGTSVPQVLYPLVIAHGTGYMALMALAVRRTRPLKFSDFKINLFIMASTAMAFGLLEHLVERREIVFEGATTSALQSLIIGLYLIPLFSHFIFDRYLWRKNHWESRLVYELEPAASQANGPPSQQREKSA